MQACFSPTHDHILYWESHRKVMWYMANVLFQRVSKELEVPLQPTTYSMGLDLETCSLSEKAKKQQRHSSVEAGSAFSICPSLSSPFCSFLLRFSLNLSNDNNSRELEVRENTLVRNESISFCSSSITKQDKITCDFY